MGLKPIMKSVGFLCPGIYIISNSLEPGTSAVTAEREAGVHSHPASNQAPTRARSSQPSTRTTVGSVGGIPSVPSHTPSWHLKFKFYSNIRMLLFHILLTHKKMHR